MEKRNFMQLLKASWGNSLLCVGLDSNIARIPGCVVSSAIHPIFGFNKKIVDATHEFVCAFKLQIAFYSAVEAEDDLKATIGYIHEQYPHIPVIIDAKRGDIGSTAEQYCQEVFERYRADAVTVNPYLGFDACRPFLEYPDKGIIILCRTSNPSASDFQDFTRADGFRLYEEVARKVSREWNEHGNCLLVMGGIRPDDQLALGAMQGVRAIVGDMPFLVPGIGAQGGDVEITVRNGRDSHGTGMIINSSRGVIFASDDEDFAEAARREAKALRDEINKSR